MRVLGIMSGTSIDSCDYAVCEIISKSIKLLDYWQVPFPSELRERLSDAAANLVLSHEVGQLHHDLGRFYGAGARKVKGLKLIGLHGQTIFHNPNNKSSATFQIGEPAYLAQKTKAIVVSNFRAADLAAGGQGAPLATMFHKLVFSEAGKHVAVQNLGGIGNVTSLDQTGRGLKIAAFDTGPANMLIDLAVRSFTNGKEAFDKNGQSASKGKVDEKILATLLKNPFFRKAPPKSSGRENFGEALLDAVLPHAMRRNDALCTLTELTARSVALSYKMFLPTFPEKVILCGGGAANNFLVTRITHHLKEISASTEVVTCARLGWPMQSIEPAAFALLAWLRFHHKPGNIPQTTGARMPVLLGQITSP